MSIVIPSCEFVERTAAAAVRRILVLGCCAFLGSSFNLWAQDVDPEQQRIVTVEIEGCPTASRLARQVQLGALERKAPSPDSACSSPDVLVPGDVVLRCGDPNDELFQWYTEALAGNAKGRAITVSIKDGNGEELRTYNLYDCFPTQWGQAAECGSSREATYKLTAHVTHFRMIRNVGKHKGDYLPAHNFKIEIDGCTASPGFCPGESDEVRLLTAEVDAAQLIERGGAGSTGTMSEITITLFDADAGAALWAWIMESQESESSSKDLRIIVKPPNNCPHPRYIMPSGCPIERVVLPTLNISPDGKGTTGACQEKITIKVGRIEFKV